MDQAVADAASMPYIGSKISLISNAEIRYEGILYSINTYESTVALQNVRTFGTEGRRQPEVHPNNKTYQFIIFKGKDIKDLTVCEPASVPEDPAIVTVNVAPTNTMMGQQQPYMNRQPGPESAAQNRGYGGANMGIRNGRINTPPYQTRNPNMSAMRGGYYGRDFVNNNHHENENYGMAGNEMDYSNPGRDGRYPNRDLRINNRPVPRTGPRRIVGELPPQLNHAMMKEVQKAFDFESSNAKFDQISNQTKENVKEGEATEGNTVYVTAPAVCKGYDKVTSFFDRLSCETIDRKDGKDARMDKVKQRQLDCDTFGPSAADASRGVGPRRAYRRGGPNRRGGFGYGGMAVRANA